MGFPDLLGWRMLAPLSFLNNQSEDKLLFIYLQKTWYSPYPARPPLKPASFRWYRLLPNLSFITVTASNSMTAPLPSYIKFLSRARQEFDTKHCALFNLLPPCDIDGCLVLCLLLPTSFPSLPQAYFPLSWTALFMTWWSGNHIWLAWRS